MAKKEKEVVKEEKAAEVNHARDAKPGQVYATVKSPGGLSLKK